MLKLAARTKQAPEQVIVRALDYFGPNGLGMTVTQRADTCATFEGGGGSVWVSACIEGKGTSVELETREWENQVKEFALKIK